MEIKSWLRSKTIQMLMLLLVPIISKFMGFDIGQYIATITGLVESHATFAEWTNFLLEAIPVFLAAVFRILAKTKLTNPFIIKPL